MSVPSKFGASLPSLRNLAHLYKVFLFNYSSIAQGSRPTEKAQTIRCMQELLNRGKTVGVVHSTPRRAAWVGSNARRNGIPDGIVQWSSGEFIFRALEQQSRGDLQAVHPKLQLNDNGPINVFEISALATPKRWTDRTNRTQPVLTPLEESGTIRRVDDLEKAQICYWDASEDEEVKEILDAVFDLCLEFRVPLLHASGCEAALTALGKEGVRRNSTEAHALSFARLGGHSFGIGKLQGCLANMQQTAGLDAIHPRDALFVSSDLGDVIEASSQGLDSVLSLQESGSQVASQLSALANAAKLEEERARRKMSMSQRVQSDSPAMMHAASMPFLSFLKLPTLLAEASRRNEEQKRQEQGGSPSVASPVARQPSGPSPLEVKAGEELWDAVVSWCSSSGVTPPVAGFTRLQWDEADEKSVQVPQGQRHQLREAGTVAAAAAGSDPVADRHSTASGSDRGASLCSTEKHRRRVRAVQPADEAWRTQPQAESVSEILGQLGGTKA